MAASYLASLYDDYDRFYITKNPIREAHKVRVPILKQMGMKPQMEVEAIDIQHVQEHHLIGDMLCYIS